MAHSSPSFSSFDFEKLSSWALAALIGYAAVRNVFEALTKPFWYDEICTWVIVHQPGVSRMWEALAHAVDGQPLGYYLLERLASVFVVNEQISFRIPSILGLAVVTLCLFLFVKLRSNSLTAFICAAIPLFTVLFDPYAVEARPYSVVVACIAFALVCYQRAPAIPWLILMGASFALAQAFHYYAIVSFFPFIVSESVLLVRRRKLRWTVWLAFSSGLLPLAGFWSLLSKFRAYYGSHYWAVPSLDGAKSSYGWFFNLSPAWGLNIAGLAVIMVLVKLLFDMRRHTGAEYAGVDLVHERTLALGFLALPFVGFIVSDLAHGGMTVRYVMPTILGFPLAAGYVLPPIKRKSVALIGILALLLAFTLQERRFWVSYPRIFVSPADSVQELVASAGHPDLPVVVSHPHDFLQLAHYASPDWRGRFVSVVDPVEAVIYTGSDTADRELQVMRDYTPLQVYDFDEFARVHPAFLLYSSNAGMGLDWWGIKLFRSGYKLKLVAMKDFYHRVFLVTQK
ncbi:MAG TPA: glycosyltransferase family 39 protein [Candidatus Acidoferrales bacterium]|nr:glycosyltransferase family 39 protein [Candidatus Acidoferrales bacterium]